MSSRIVFCIILFGSVLLFQGFSASYTSFLSVTTQLKPFETVEQLYSDTDYKVGTREGVAAAAMFRKKAMICVILLKWDRISSWAIM